MASLRFPTFLFGLCVSISLHSYAFSLQDMEKHAVAATNSITLVDVSPLSESKLDVLDAVPTQGEARIEEIGGRKMMNKRVFIKKDEGLNINVETSTSLKISDTASDNLKLKKPKHNTDCNLSNARHRRRLKVRMSSFVAINADYKAPKSHPPRNN